MGVPSLRQHSTELPVYIPVISRRDQSPLALCVAGTPVVVGQVLHSPHLVKISDLGERVRLDLREFVLHVVRIHRFDLFT